MPRAVNNTCKDDIWNGNQLRIRCLRRDPRAIRSPSLNTPPGPTHACVEEALLKLCQVGLAHQQQLDVQCDLSLYLVMVDDVIAVEGEYVLHLELGCVTCVVSVSRGR